ncbi:PCMD domain-containing protein [Prolixibacteraceae bacterium Z1-6]|uniref:PCMD domain-containing protein n=1 Tax=Draconibacterium aestuarii TaxID=2998507 RepID=A0A9X3FBQ6_9BACT|nr:PCMD domain-containing protein [Prolixibacteraceae bacterium Z1-6]
MVSNQSGYATIDNTLKLITVEIPAGVDLTEVSIVIFEISTFAQADVSVGDKLDLSDDATILVTAEDGTIHNWTVKSFVASATPQLDNWDLNEWYKTSSGYFEPGADAATTIWRTGNPGTQILNKLATIPYDMGSGNLAAHLETLDNGKLAGTFGAPISAGSIYTGVFDSEKIDPSNPQAAIDFGTPFVGRPIKIQFKYSYQPGDVNKDKQGNVLSYGDACDIYVLLEVRLGGKTERLATAWFRSDQTQDELTNKEVVFTYGELDDNFPEYMFPLDHGFVSADSAQFILPTHITFVASSSFDGANFAGAIGSKLIIDDIVMVYE